MAGFDASHVVGEVLPQFQGNFSVGSHGKYHTMPCVPNSNLSKGFKRAVFYLTGRDHRFRKSGVYHPVKCCNFESEKPTQLLGLQGETLELGRPTQLLELYKETGRLSKL